MYENIILGEPLFGYYTSDNAWVRRSMYNLTDMVLTSLSLIQQTVLPIQNKLKLFEIQQVSPTRFQSAKCAFYTSGSSGKQ